LRLSHLPSRARETRVGSCGPTAHVIPAMGIAHGFASTVILRAERQVYAGGLRQSNAFWGGLRRVLVAARG
jgi:hypothetical protein